MALLLRRFEAGQLRSKIGQSFDHQPYIAAGAMQPHLRWQASVLDAAHAAECGVS